MNMRVLHVVHSFDLSGRTRFIHDLSRGLAGWGFSFGVVSLTRPAKYRPDDLECVELGKTEGVSLGIALKLARLARQQRAAVLHSHGRGVLVYAVGAKMLGSALRLVHTIHRSDGDRISRYPSVATWLLRRVDSLVSVSEAAAAEFERVNCWPRSRIRTVYNGIDLNRFDGVRHQRDPRPGEPVIGMVANLTADKDHPTLLRAFAQVLAKQPRARLLLIGDGPCAEELKSLSKALGIGERVAFLGRRTDIPSLLSTLDLFAYATRTEGLGLAIMEAMAAGVPVVASAVGGILEIVTDGVTGRLFPAGDAARMCDAMLAALSDPTGSRLMAERAMAAARERFSIERMCAEYARIYTENS